MVHDVRWLQRFAHFERATALLREAIDLGLERLSPLEREGTIQRFEVAVELGWKTLKDFLEHEGVALDPITPRTVIREAFSAGLIADGQVWVDMIDHRNLLSHSYDAGAFELAAQAVRDRYLAALEAAADYLRSRRTWR